MPQLFGVATIWIVSQSLDASTILTRFFLQISELFNYAVSFSSAANNRSAPHRSRVNDYSAELRQN